MDLNRGVFVVAKIRVVDFFCSCGGTSAGLEASGMKILAGIDCDAEAGKTFKLNFPKAEFINKDITKLYAPALKHLIPKNRQFRLLFSACAPCQPFTKQNTLKKNEDKRHSLLNNLHRFIRRYKPEYIFLENVPGLQKVSEDKAPFTSFLKLLDRLSYQTEKRIIKSQDYGVPQYRQRLVLLASRLGKIDFPKATHGPNAKHDHPTVWEWISDLPRIKAGNEHATIKNHRAAYLSELNLKRIKAIPIGGSRADWPKKLQLKCHKDYNGHTDVYGRMLKNKPASALTTRCISLSNGRYGHPTQSRAISVREAARLQTFPDDFEFIGSLNSMARQIGNAVPVLLAVKFGKRFKKHSEKIARKK